MIFKKYTPQKKRALYAVFSFANYSSFKFKVVDFLTVSKILDHENLNITLKVYTHQLKEMEQKNGQVIRNIFDSIWP